MVRLLPPTPGAAALGLGNVIDNVVADGAQEPAWVAVDEGGGECVRLLAACPAGERARGVVVSADDATLVAAHRLGVGGAALLPPSSPGLLEAWRAASSSAIPAPVFDPGAVELHGETDRVMVAGFSHRAFWRAQLGDRVLSRMLMDLAAALQVPPAVLPWPALVMVQPDRDRILEAWKPLASGAGRPGNDLVVFEVVPDQRETLSAVYSALIEHDEQPHTLEGDTLEPVYELPNGRLVGWWGPEPGPHHPDGWVAAPVHVAGSKCRWQVSESDRITTIEDVLGVADLAPRDGAGAVRMPGSLSGNLRPGTPAGLLVQRMADAAARLGLALWIPNVDAEALRFALRLPGRVWVDGPAVPQ